MGVKLAKALGCHVVGLSRSETKRKFGVETCGASDFLASSDLEAMKQQRRSFDLILNTIPSDHDERASLAREFG